MFDPKSNRLIYGDILTPPPGYTLGAAICTTYSLDLEALVSSLVALGLNEATDTELLKSPVNTLHAIERVSRKVVVFCEAGQTRIPRNSSPLLLLLEKMISPVVLPDPKGKTNYPSFHPKTWTIRYDSPDDKPVFRFIVMSRNLTFDRSWDVSLVLEGKEEPGGRRKIKPLLDFVSFLRNTINIKDPDRALKRSIINEMFESLQDVRFRACENDKPFRDFDILPLGIGDGAYDMFRDDLFNIDYGHGIHDIVTVSPFISKSIIKRLDSENKVLKNGSKRILITRRSELAKLKGSLHNTDVYVMKDTIVDGENEISEDGVSDAVSLQDIHAKVYLSVKNSDVRLCLGSMNASERGLGYNVEMMVRLFTTPHYLSRSSFIKDIMGEDLEDKGNPFMRIDLDSLQDEEPEKSSSSSQELKRLLRMRLTAEVRTTATGLYDVIINCGAGKIPESVIIMPLRAKGLSRPLEKLTVFTGLRLLEVSEFYSISIGEGEEKVESLILVPTKGIPIEREKSIISYVISDRRKFAEYVAFVLGDSSEQVMLEMTERGDMEGRAVDSKKYPPLTALYERMLRVACDEPERLKDIQRLVKLIDDEDIVTPEFKDTYRTFMSALGYKYDG